MYNIYRLQYAIDELKLVSSFEQGKVNLQTGVQLEGLWLQGCEFDGSRLNEIKDTSGSSSELINLPVCNISWIKREDPEPYSSGTVVCFLFHLTDNYRIFQSIIQLTEKSFFALLMFLITEKIGRELLVVLLYS